MYSKPEGGFTAILTKGTTLPLNHISWLLWFLTYTLLCALDTLHHTMLPTVHETHMMNTQKHD